MSRSFSSHATCYQENKGSKWALFNIQNSGAVISFLLVLIKCITSFRCFFFHGVEISYKKALHQKTPFFHDTKTLLWWYQLVLPLIRFRLLIVLLQLEFVISVLFWHRLWLPVTFQRYCHVIRNTCCTV